MNTSTHTADRAATKPRVRAATKAEVAKYEAAVQPLLSLPVGKERAAAIQKLREQQGIFVNFACGRQYRMYN